MSVSRLSGKTEETRDCYLVLKTIRAPVIDKN